MRGALLIVLTLCLGLQDAQAKGEVRVRKPNLPTFRRKLLEANTPERVGKALDDLQAYIGKPKWFADHGAFGDWLGTLPDGRDEHVLVQQRRGWAYLVARRGTDGIAPLEAAMKKDPGDGLTRAYLGECLRQAGRYMDAVEMLTTAARCGLQEAYLPQGVMECAVALRKTRPSNQAKGLPDYVRALRMYLAERPDELRLRQSLATWLLTDAKTYEKPTTERGRLWAHEGGSELLQVADAPSTDPTQLREAGLLVARSQDGAASRSLAFELLSWAVRRSYVPQNDTHRAPEALVDLAEHALQMHRFALAQRCLAQRLALGPSPRATRLARALPADLDAR